MVVDAQGQVRALEIALAKVADRWSLLVVEALLDGPRRFNQLQEALGGIATNVLAQRLRHLEREGVIVAHPYSRRPLRHAYELTRAGKDLAGALRLLTQWGVDHGGIGESPLHAACGTTLEARWYCPTCARVVEDDEADELRYL